MDSEFGGRRRPSESDIDGKEEIISDVAVSLCAAAWNPTNLTQATCSNKNNFRWRCYELWNFFYICCIKNVTITVLMVLNKLFSAFLFAEKTFDKPDEIPIGPIN